MFKAPSNANNTHHDYERDQKVKSQGTVSLLARLNVALKAKTCVQFLILLLNWPFVIF